MRPVSIFDFFVEYKVLNVNPRISTSLIWAIKAEILHGFPGGCLNDCSGSSVSQYSSSHSMGYSMSKLIIGQQGQQFLLQNTYSSFCKAHGRPRNEPIHLSVTIKDLWGLVNR